MNQRGGTDVHCALGGPGAPGGGRKCFFWHSGHPTMKLAANKFHSKGIKTTELP